MGYVDFYKLLGNNRHMLTRQELRTLRGQAKAGDYDAAQRGLEKILMRKKTVRGRDTYATQAEPTV